ncbi:LOW QUALITY PROTEIN: COPII coat assembly protein sec16-like [Pogonomyrmex barbatus]|uniref:LOW QUALITY PROTEIN: COPII coat assembly protein sec16-like n=1 Tax=Pogonomyrmex barbatus TaxID=144034 RepID=A0A8N1S4J8_9HYME|nr:LOW QUALITY PROTEIN: COPII coat assembly protein sec16-like [Pogonomyrmex barbatus]
MFRTMISTMKILFWILSLGVILLIAIVNHSPSTSGHADNVEKIADLQIIHRHRRAVWPSTIHYCKVNQYYDHEEGRCLGVPGGGKVLHVESRRSCGVNILKPHCRSSLYYHICKRDKSILAQCANRQIFDNRLQRCVYYDSSKLIPNIIPPDEYMYHHHISVPSCTRSGRFPIPSHCSMFYTCDSNGHRFYQNVFKCPQNTGYHMDRGMCIVMSDCVNDNSVDPTVCVPNAPGENVESLNSNEDTEGNVKETSVIFEGNEASTSDSIIENEENVNFKSYDDVTATSVNIMDTPENNHDSDTDDTSLLSSKSIKEVSVPDDINEMMMHSQISDSPENAQTIPDERQNEENESLFGLQITSPSTIEFDDASHSITISMTSIKPEYRTNDDIDSEITNTASLSPDSYILSKLNEETQDVTTKQYKNIEDGVVTLSNFNSEAIEHPYPTSTIFNAPEIDDVSYKTNENIQDIITEENIHDEDAVTPSNFNIDSFDSHSASIVSNVPESSPVSDMPSEIDEMPDAITEEYRNIEDNATSLSPINDMPSEIGEKVPDVITEKYRNNEDSAVSPSNFNTDSIDLYSASTVSDVPESSPINDMPSEIGEEVPDAITEKYKNNEDSAVSPSNFNTDSVDLNSAPTASDVPESSPISDMPSEIDEMPDAVTEEYRNNEDSAVSPSNFNTDSVDLYSAPIVSDVPESSPINDMPSEIGEEMPDAITEEYRNIEDSSMTPSNFNTDSVDLYSASTISDLSEPSLISDPSSKLNEETQNVTTEMYKKDDGTLLNPIIEDDQNPTALNDTPATENISRNYESDVLSSTPTILSPQTAIDGATTEGLFETIPLTNNKFEDTNSTLDGENSSTQYLSEDTDNLYLTTTRSISSLEDITESNIATTPFTQNLPTVSDTDLITQVDENSKEVSQDSLTE